MIKLPDLRVRRSTVMPFVYGIFFAFSFPRFLHAEIVLEAILSDPDQTLASGEPSRAPFRGKNIAIPGQATAVPLMALAPQDANLVSSQKLELASEPPLGSKPFFRASQQGDKFTPLSFCGVEITPDHDGASLAALSNTNEEHITLNGAIDFFFRATQEPSRGDGLQLKFLDQSGKDSFRLVFGTDRSGQGLTASLIRQDSKCFDTDLDGQPDSSMISTVPLTSNATRQIESGKVYHAALLFQANADGSTSMKTFLKEGTAAIDTTKEEDLTSEARFRAFNPGGKIKSALPNGKIVLGTFPSRSIAGMTYIFDLAALRISHPAPDQLPALD